MTPTRRPRSTMFALPLSAIAPMLALPTVSIAQTYATGSGPYSYTDGPTRPLDGTPRSGVYSAQPAPRYETPRYETPRGNLGSAAPESYAPPPIWNGLYVGAHAGYRFSSTAVEGWNVPAVSQSGFQGGGHLGYNFQTGNAVFGVESDLTFGSASSTSTLSGAALMMRDSWSSTLRGRIGYAFGPALLYGTGGLALADQQVTLTSPALSASNLRVGYVLGGGIEYKFSPKVSTRVEALHYGYNDRNLNWASSAQGVKQDSNVVRAGVTYHFN